MNYVCVHLKISDERKVLSSPLIVTALWSDWHGWKNWYFFLKFTIFGELISSSPKTKNVYNIVMLEACYFLSTSLYLQLISIISTYLY